MPSRPLTEEQKEDAKRLRFLYERWKSANPDSGPQDQIGPAHGMSQSAFSQRLNGSLSLTPESAVAFAKLLGCAVSDFSPSLARRIANLSPTPARDVALAAGPASASETRRVQQREGGWIGAKMTPAQQSLLSAVELMGRTIPDERAKALAELVLLSGGPVEAPPKVTA